ncbi:MAG: hypothetical protein FWG35_01800 [Spirochaetaceae bacterium]|nr:hypothetical protein [Spirochaetaceae bacterium]
MTDESREFCLPLGLSHGGKTYRRGKMRPVTTGDELEIQDAEDAGFAPRCRDILLLARVIENIDGLGPMNPQLIEELYEADFLYLQLLYREINGNGAASASCPNCDKPVKVSFPLLYENTQAAWQEANA